MKSPIKIAHQGKSSRGSTISETPDIIKRKPSQTGVMYFKVNLINPGIV